MKDDGVNIKIDFTTKEVSSASVQNHGGIWCLMLHDADI
jgi:hypothetical protein